MPDIAHIVSVTLGQKLKTVILHVQQDRMNGYAVPATGQGDAHPGAAPSTDARSLSRDKKDTRLVAAANEISVIGDNPQPQLYGGGMQIPGGAGRDESGEEQNA
jgi:hypothetical protein